MNISVVNGSRRFDGHTVLFHDFVEGLATQGLHPRVYTCVDPSSPEDFPEEGERIYGRRFPGGGMGEMAYNRFFPILARRVSRLPGDLLHVNDAYLARTAEYRDNVVATVIDLGKRTTRYYPRLYSWVHNRNLRSVHRCRGVVCSTEYVRQEILRVLRLSLERVRVVPPFSRVPPLPSPREPPSPPTPQAPWTLLCVGTDRPHKNLLMFLEVLARLDSRFRGLVVSRLRPETLARIDVLGLRPRLTVESDVPDMASTYRSAHILVFPSLFEGFGIPLVEAMGQGLPVVASRKTCVPEVVGNGGLLVDPGDIAGWTKAIEDLAQPDVYRRWSQSAWKRGLEYDAVRTGKSLLAAYQTFMELPPATTAT